MAKTKKTSRSWVDKKFDEERKKIFKKYGPIEGEKIWRDWLVEGKKTKPTKKVARASTKSMTSIPGDKRIHNPKQKVRLSTGGSPKKYGIVDNLKKKRK